MPLMRISGIIADTYGTCEKILLYCGVIFFLTEACLVFGTLEYIPMDIQVNALVLGTLSAAGAILFFIDLHHQSSLIKSVAQIDAKSLLAKNVPSVLQKSSIQLKPSVPANVQIYPAGCREYLKPQGGKLKARVLQTDV
ncbi:PREDICTED: uncharacterized protein LOC108354442 [Rhagoletis zephyria]|uniref:uncharacterized protein LOC108354442 n=1 Tax=Rhagoletis zephyria TaxID=28612 RepID=UPI0008115EF7|nr:PREDICTED: uncharacterized protein LOC108354442 [Rhagoletis zephyria]